MTKLFRHADARGQDAASGSISDGSLFFTWPTRALTG
jgi:hypothetical protein